MDADLRSRVPLEPQALKSSFQGVEHSRYDARDDFFGLNFSAQRVLSNFAWDVYSYNAYLHYARLKTPRREPEVSKSGLHLGHLWPSRPACCKTSSRAARRGRSIRSPSARATFRAAPERPRVDERINRSSCRAPGSTATSPRSSNRSPRRSRRSAATSGGPVECASSAVCARCRRRTRCTSTDGRSPSSACISTRTASTVSSARPR